MDERWGNINTLTATNIFGNSAVLVMCITALYLAVRLRNLLGGDINRGFLLGGQTQPGTI